MVLRWVLATLVVAGPACGRGKVAQPVVRPVPVIPVVTVPAPTGPDTPTPTTAASAVARPATAAPAGQSKAAAANDDPSILRAASAAAPAPASRGLVSLGSISIPSISMTSPIFDGGTLDIIDHGPGHLPGTALPGHLGNTVFAGHRVTHSHPFFDIDLVRVGDRVIFDTPWGRFTYEVTGSRIVTPNDLSILRSTPDATMTIFGCHPKHSADFRYVVFGRLVGEAVPDANKPPTHCLLFLCSAH